MVSVVTVTLLFIQKLASNALRQLWKFRSDIDLVGNVINIMNGRWIKQTASIGAGVDSFYGKMEDILVISFHDRTTSVILTTFLLCPL